MQPKTLAHYEILGSLGAGGMGQVYRARDTRLGREVALKTLPPDTAADPERLARFQREAQALAALDHPNIVTVYSVEEADGAHFLTMALVEGTTLDREIPDAGLPLPRFFEIAVPLADAVAAAHDRSIIHRDLKPGNIMLTADGRLKVLDFGLAKLAEGPDTEYHDTTRIALTQEGVAVGTVPYMSPEQAENRPIDHRSDIFSLGTLFYELLTGRRPFTGDSSAGLIASILKEPPPPIADRRKDTPAGLNRLVARCLEKKPADRYVSVRDVLGELKTLHKELDTAPRGEAEEPAADLGIAVFPFSDMSPGKDQDYFCEGMAEEIMNALVQIGGIRVASRTSAFRIREEGRDLADIGRVLKVGHLLEGSVRVAGNRMRVTAQLVDVATGYHLWSERYDREAEDVFAIQDEIAAGVVDAVKSRLSPAARAVRPRSQVKNLEAYRHYLKARHARYSLNDHAGAARSYREALALDPGHAASWVGLAEVISLSATYVLRPAPSARAEARKALATAAGLQGESGTSLYVHGMIHFAEWNWRAAEDALRGGVAKEPDNVQARCWLGLLLSLLGRFDEASAELERARETDPVAAYPYGMSANACLVMNRIDEAERLSQYAVDFEPESTLALLGRSVALVLKNRHDEGIALAEKAVQVSRRGPYLLGILAWALASAGRTDEARAILGELQARPSPEPGVPAPTAVSEAWTLAVLGEVDAAWKVLERARDEGHAFVIQMNLGGDALLGDPRYGEYMKSLGLTGP